MNGEPIVKGGIIAAGAGVRLRQAGWTMPKPLVPVAGMPLIEHVIRNFLAAGISSLVIIVNEQARECADWVRSRFPDLDLEIIVKTTDSSLESFLDVGGRLGSGRSLISTVDAWCPEEAFVTFVRTARLFPSHAIVLAVTPFVDDERPLWVNLDASGRVTHLGGDSGDAVTAGMYLVPEQVWRMAPPPEVKRLREFLVWLLNRGEPVYGVRLPVVVDVDRGRDVSLAETLAHRGGGPEQSESGG
ncbi:MAG: NTP transferase domain-containing protein [candidate division NC10 bacterium]